MSFSSQVKEELAGHVSKARHCRLAELAAILGGCGRIRFNPPSIEVQSERSAVVKKEPARDSMVRSKNRPMQKTAISYTIIPAAAQTRMVTKPCFR